MDGIHVVGCGGVGCAVGYALARAGAAVTFVEQAPAKLAWMRAHGVQLGRLPAVAAPAVDFAEWQPAPGAVVLLCTKCYDNAAVLERLPPGARVVPIQNGFDLALDARGVAAEGVVSFVAGCRPDRTHARLAHGGRLYLGGGDLASTLAERLGDAPFRVTLCEDVGAVKCAKLAYDAALSPLAAAGGLDNVQVLLRPRVRELFFELLRENLAILTAAGVGLAKVGPLPPDVVAGALTRRWLARPLAWILARALRGSHNSIAADLATGRTEIEHYNGRLVALAGDGPCLLNRMVVALIGRMTARHLPPHPDRLDELYRAFFRTATPVPERLAG
jgi:2-dehydropantoate 2-reductase